MRRDGVSPHSVPCTGAKAPFGVNNNAIGRKGASPTAYRLSAAGSRTIPSSQWTIHPAEHGRRAWIRSALSARNLMRIRSSLAARQRPRAGRRYKKGAAIATPFPFFPNGSKDHSAAFLAASAALSAVAAASVALSAEAAAASAALSAAGAAASVAVAAASVACEAASVAVSAAASASAIAESAVWVAASSVFSEQAATVRAAAAAAAARTILRMLEQSLNSEWNTHGVNCAVRKACPEGQTSRAQIIAIQTLCKHVRGLDNFHIIAAHPFVPASWGIIATIS